MIPPLIHLTIQQIFSLLLSIIIKHLVCIRYVS